MLKNHFAQFVVKEDLRNIITVCDVRLYEHNNKRTVVVSEYIDKATGEYVFTGDYLAAGNMPCIAGRSIDNSIETIAWEIIHQLGVNFDKLVSHIPARFWGVHDNGVKEEFSFVEFNGIFALRYSLPSPTWVSTTRKEIEKLIGAVFVDVRPDELIFPTTLDKSRKI